MRDASGVAEQIPLTALLSWAWTAFAIETDNAVEAAGSERVRRLFRISMTVARFDDYASAQRAVDRLSDDGFPVGKLDIVGSDLRLVERVTG
jgi:hypothetical protein